MSPILHLLHSMHCSRFVANLAFNNLRFSIGKSPFVSIDLRPIRLSFRRNVPDGAFKHAGHAHRKEGKRVRLFSRPGNDLTHRFPLIVETLAQLRSHSCIVDGEAVSCGEDGIASFDQIRYRHYDHTVFLFAFDLIELDGVHKVADDII
jgi:hypothetical protein